MRLVCKAVREGETHKTVVIAVVVGEKPQKKEIFFSPSPTWKTSKPA